MKILLDDLKTVWNYSIHDENHRHRVVAGGEYFLPLIRPVTDDKRKHWRVVPVSFYTILLMPTVSVSHIISSRHYQWLFLIHLSSQTTPRSSFAVRLSPYYTVVRKYSTWNPAIAHEAKSIWLKSWNSSLRHPCPVLITAACLVDTFMGFTSEIQYIGNTYGYRSSDYYLLLDKYRETLTRQKIIVEFWIVNSTVAVSEKSRYSAIFMKLAWWWKVRDYKWNFCRSHSKYIGREGASKRSTLAVPSCHGWWTG